MPRVSFDDWLLALHVLSAVSFVAGIVLFWVLIVAVRSVDTPEDTLRLGPIAKVGNAAVGIGMGGTIVLGVWLAFSVGGYDIWDGWIIAALVLWLIGAELGRRTGAAFMEGPTKAQELAAAGRRGTRAVEGRRRPQRARRRGVHGGDAEGAGAGGSSADRPGPLAARGEPDAERPAPGHADVGRRAGEAQRHDLEAGRMI